MGMVELIEEGNCYLFDNLLAEEEDQGKAIGNKDAAQHEERAKEKGDKNKVPAGEAESGMLPAKAREDETDGEMSATLLAKAAEENEVADVEVDGAEAAEDDEKQRCLSRLQSGTISWQKLPKKYILGHYHFHKKWWCTAPPQHQ
jgi:hypothetical protein